MAQTRVIVAIPYDLYKVLIADQERLRKAEGKKPALSIIILGYCNQWLKVRTHPEVVQGISEIIPPEPIPEQTHKPIKPIYSYDELAAWQEELTDREDRVREREMSVIERDQLVSTKTIEMFKIKDDFFEQKEALKKNEINQAVLKLDKESLEKQNQQKDELIREMKNQLNEMKQEVVKTLRKIDVNTDKNSFWDKLTPYLPLIATAISTVILKKQMSGNKDLDEFEKEISDLYASMKPDIQKGFIEYMQSFAKKNKGNNNGESKSTK